MEGNTVLNDKYLSDEESKALWSEYFGKLEKIYDELDSNVVDFIKTLRLDPDERFEICKIIYEFFDFVQNYYMNIKFDIYDLDNIFENEIILFLEHSKKEVDIFSVFHRGALLNEMFKYLFEHGEISRKVEVDLEDVLKKDVIQKKIFPADYTE